MQNCTKNWNRASAFLIVLTTVLSFSSWYTFPKFVDFYYHAASMAGFLRAGGVALFNFWEYSPVGRPNLYPPFLPLFMAFLMKAGMPVVAIIRLVQAVMFPAMLLVVWQVTRKIFNSRYAFFSLVSALASYSFFTNTVNAVPSALALMLLLYVFLEIEVNNWRRAGMLLGAMFYIHAGLSIASTIALIAYLLYRYEKRTTIIRGILSALIIALPIIIHMFINRGYFRFVNVNENSYLEVNILIYGLAIAGSLMTIRKTRVYKVPFFILLACIIAFSRYSYRFISGAGMFGIILFAAVALGRIYFVMAGWFKCSVFRKKYVMYLPYVISFFVLTVSPVIFIKAADVFFVPHRGSAIAHLGGFSRGVLMDNETSIYNERFIGEITSVISGHTGEDDIIYCNNNHIGALLSALTMRSTSTGTLEEVMPVKSIDPIAPDRVVVLLKRSDGVIAPSERELIEKFSLEVLTETTIARIYFNAGAVEKSRVKGAVIPFLVCLMVIAVFVTLFMAAGNITRA